MTQTTRKCAAVFNTLVGEIRSMDLFPDSTVLGRRYLPTGDNLCFINIAYYAKVDFGKVKPLPPPPPTEDKTVIHTSQLIILRLKMLRNL